MFSSSSFLEPSVKSQKREDQRRRKENVTELRHNSRQAPRSQRNRQDGSGVTNGGDSYTVHSCPKIFVSSPRHAIGIHVLLLSIQLFFCDCSCRKSGPFHCLDHDWDINRLRIIGNSRFLFRETHFCFLDSFQPFQGCPYDSGSSPSGHPVDS